MPKKIWIALVGLLVALPIVTFAGDIKDITTTSIFEVGAFDQSKSFLEQLFGTVGTVLHGTSGQLLGQLFRIFNIGVLVIAGIFFIWTTIQSVINTAHEGQFMGGSSKKPAFTILRTVAGFGLLVPSFATGYSMIQAAMMWVILQGVGFANTAWNAALDYLEDGGVIYAPQRENAADLVDMAGTIMAAQVCMYYYENKARSGLGAGQYISSFRPTINLTNVKFPKDPGNSPGDAGCGGFSWNMGDKNQYVQAAIQQVIIDTQTVSQRIVDPRGWTTQEICKSVLDSVLGAAADWSNILIPARQMSTMDAETKKFFKQARRDGWMFAGSYYFRLAGLQAEFRKSTTVKFATTNAIEGIGMCAGDTCDYLHFTKSGGAKCSGTKGNITLNTDDTKLKLTYKQLASYLADASDSAQQIDSEATGMPRIKPPNLGILAPMLAPVMNGVTSATGSLKPGGADPILGLKNAGEIMVGVVAAFMIVATVMMFALSAVSSIMSSVYPVGYAIRDAFQALMVSLVPLMIMILTQGVVMATYVPLIPYIIFTFGAIAWFVIVIETLVAAPLVALGLTHPEGHETLGRAEPAVLLILNVFLRPILMIFGLFAGMILSKIGLKILGIGLVNVLATMGGMNVFLLLGLLFVYISLVIQMLTTTYGLITVIPDKTIRWIGGQAEQTAGVAEALSGAKGAAEATGKAMGDSMGKAYESGAGNADKMEARKRGGDFDKGPGASGDSPSDTGGATPPAPPPSSGSGGNEGGSGDTAQKKNDVEENEEDEGEEGEGENENENEEE